VIYEVATVRIGEYTIPLLGIPKSSSEELCGVCKKQKHLTEITYDGERFVCGQCIAVEALKVRAGKKIT
jgi:hypothetical protein